MDMASNVQATLFPPTPPEVNGWDIAFVFRPMAGVSGDMYDFYTEGDTLNGVALFDVSGHGIASGLITMIARTVFQRNFMRKDNP
jgi:sigma-B regulation protein RsbU (phosphoserine phosphatase)